MIYLHEIQDALDSFIYGTIKQNDLARVTVKSLHELGYFEERGLQIDSELLKQDPIYLTDIEVGEMTFWAFNQGTVFEEIASQLELFVHGGYEAPFSIEDMDQIYSRINNVEIKNVTPAEELKIRAYFLLAADYVAYEGNMIEL
jgi:hypothetical protein